MNDQLPKHTDFATQDYRAGTEGFIVSLTAGNSAT